MTCKTLLKTGFDKIILWNVINDKWQNILILHQRKDQAKDVDNMLFVCHFILVELCTTSLNVFGIGNVADKNHISN